MPQVSRTLYDPPRAARVGGICNASESVQGKLILIPRPSRAREVVTPRGTNMSAVAHNRTPVKSDRTALVCWGLKWKMKRKRALYRGNQAGECLMTHNNIILLWNIALGFFD